MRPPRYRTVFPEEGWIDLLKSVDLERDVNAGEWKHENGALLFTKSGAGGNQFVRFPAFPRGGFELRVNFERILNGPPLSAVGCTTQFANQRTRKRAAPVRKRARRVRINPLTRSLTVAARQSQPTSNGFSKSVVHPSMRPNYRVRRWRM